MTTDKPRKRVTGDRYVGNTAEKGRKGRARSPWDAGPMCDTPNAMQSFKRNRAAKS